MMPKYDLSGIKMIWQFGIIGPLCIAPHMTILRLELEIGFVVLVKHPIFHLNQCPEIRLLARYDLYIFICHVMSRDVE